MPTYDFKCKKCHRMMENVLLRITHDDVDKPHCCDKPMQYHISTPPMVHWVDPVIEPFRHIATPDKPIIRSMREHREYMKRNDFVPAGDMPPPTRQEEIKTLEGINKSIEAITPTTEQKQMLKESGLDSIVD